MPKYLFLIPLYNDWRSLNLLLKKINLELSKKKRVAEIIILNDASISKKKIFKKQLFFLKRIKIINLKTNLGSQKAISIGLKYVSNLKKNFIITVMDSDGEDDPSKINEMIDSAEKTSDHIIVSSRTKRKEILIFRILYRIHLFLTFVLTGKWISFGNYSSFDSKNLSKLQKNNSSWFALSSTIIKNCKIKNIYAERKKRFFDRSKVSFLSLFFHSLRIVSVFQKRVLVNSILYIFVLFFLNIILDNYILIVLIFSLIFINVSILIAKEYLELDQFDRRIDLIKNIDKIK